MINNDKKGNAKVILGIQSNTITKNLRFEVIPDPRCQAPAKKSQEMSKYVKNAVQIKDAHSIDGTPL